MLHVNDGSNSVHSRSGPNVNRHEMRRHAVACKTLQTELVPYLCKILRDEFCVLDAEEYV